MVGIVTVCSGKGGVGKTTSTQAIANGLRVLGEPPAAVMDLDYGASLTRGYGWSPSSGLSEAVLNGVVSFESALHDTHGEVPVIPASAALSVVGKDKMMSWRDRLRDLAKTRLIVIDTSDDILSAPVTAAILAADILIIPVPLSLMAYKRTFPEIAGLLATFNHAPDVIWFGTAVDVRTSAAKHVLKVFADDGIELAVLVPKGIAVEEAVIVERSVIAVDPRSKTALAYMDLSRVVFARLRRINGLVTTAPQRQVRALEPLAVNG